MDAFVAPAIPQPSAVEVSAQCAGERAPVLLDVREAWEFDQGSLPGAHHVPLSNLAEALEALQLAPTTPVVTFCHHGVRSLRAAAALRAAGFVDVASMAGGIDAWSLAVDPAVLRY